MSSARTSRSRCAANTTLFVGILVQGSFGLPAAYVPSSWRHTLADDAAETELDALVDRCLVTGRKIGNPFKLGERLLDHFTKMKTIRGID